MATPLSTRDAKFQYHATGVPVVFPLPPVVGGSRWLLEVAGRAPLLAKSVGNTNNVNADKFAGNEPESMVSAGDSSQSGGAGVVPVMDFEEKLQLYCQPTPCQKLKTHPIWSTIFGRGLNSHLKLKINNIKMSWFRLGGPMPGLKDPKEPRSFTEGLPLVALNVDPTLTIG